MTVEIDRTGTGLHVTTWDGTGVPVDPEAADPTLIRLAEGGAEATVYPGVGFNLIDWRVSVHGRQVQAMHAEPDVLSGGSGTRSGNPILFPFPNRIAGATFDFEATSYRLPVAHPGDRHAIHGFCAKRSWGHFRQSGDSSVTGEFLLSRDAPDTREAWPGDLRLEVTYTLAATSLQITATVSNPDVVPVPYGLGYHPYFSALGADSPDDLTLQVGAAAYWVLADLIPTGQVAPVSGDNDLTEPVIVGNRVLDDVLTDLDPFEPGADGLMERARLTGGDASLAIRGDASIRDVVVFTPDNRESVAVEPYTCPTDAVHLTGALGRDVGWRVLQPGNGHTVTVRYEVHPAVMAASG